MTRGHLLGKKKHLVEIKRDRNVLFKTQSK